MTELMSFTEDEVKNRALPDCYIYISHLDGSKGEIQYWRLPQYPDEVTDQMSSSFSEQNALGRSAPVYTFSNAGPRTVQFNLEFHRDMIDEANVGYSNVPLKDGEDHSDKLISAHSCSCLAPLLFFHPSRKKTSSAAFSICLLIFM